MSRKRKATELGDEGLSISRTPTREPHVYDPLPPGTIRVLVIQPGRYEDPLQGQLELCQLDHEPSYRAISYTWGPAVFPYTLSLPFGKELRITESLHGALRRFREVNKPVTLWADAICINQKDIDERNAQVAMMGQIYARAEEVLVWLGESKRSDAAAFWMMEFMHDQHQSDEHGTSFCDDPWDAVEELPRAFSDRLSMAQGGLRCSCCDTRFSVPNRSLTDALAALSSLWKRSWFGRLWVLQEIILAPKSTYHCGSHRTPFNLLYNASRFHYCYVLRFGGPGDDESNKGTVNDVLDMCELASRAVSTYGPTKALIVTAHRELSDPRDRIYAVRSLVKPKILSEMDKVLWPDYSISLEELWTKTTVFCLTSSDRWHTGMLFLALAGLQCRTVRGTLPSWTLDLRQLDQALLRKDSYWTEEARNQKAGGASSALRILYAANDPETLRVRARIVTTVRSVLPSSEFPQSDQEGKSSSSLDGVVRYLRKQLLPWYNYCRQFVSSSAAWSEGLREDYGLLLRHGRRYSDPHRYSTSDSSPMLNRLATCISEQHEAPAMAGPAKDTYVRQVHKDLLPFLRRDLYSYNLDCTRIMAWTDNGEVGWVPARTEPGDQVCIFAGAPFPFVIRSIDDEFYELLGDAYMHGIMHGEAMPQDEAELEWIALK